MAAAVVIVVHHLPHHHLVTPLPALPCASPCPLAMQCRVSLLRCTLAPVLVPMGKHRPSQGFYDTFVTVCISRALRLCSCTTGLCCKSINNSCSTSPIKKIKISWSTAPKHHNRACAGKQVTMDYVYCLSSRICKAPCTAVP